MTTIGKIRGAGIVMAVAAAVAGAYGLSLCARPGVEPSAAVLQKLIVLDDTHFDFDTATLTPEGAKAVTQNIQVLRDNPDAVIRVAGYASASGTVEHNQKLSERRARAVQDIFIKEGGVAPGRLTTIGYGETWPAKFEPIPKDIDSKAARANMRVLFEVSVKPAGEVAGQESGGTKKISHGTIGAAIAMAVAAAAGVYFLFLCAKLKAEPNVVILQKLIVLDDAHFEADTANLTKEGAAIVTRNIQVLDDNPEAIIRIAGYALVSGMVEHNRTLSEKRARAVEALLVKEGGIAAKRLTTIGYGETRPAKFAPIPKHMIDTMEARASVRVLFEVIVTSEGR